MLLNSLRAAILVISLSSFTVHSAIITSISNLDIGGTIYNVTFNPGDSFNTLFDHDVDGIFGDGDGSIINHAPTFFGNEAGADLAALAIIRYLGNNDNTVGEPGDSFLIPHSTLQNDLTASSDTLIKVAEDKQGTFSFMRNEVVFGYPIATFELVTQSVPLPNTIALAGLALAVMGAMGCRRRVS